MINTKLDDSDLLLVIDVQNDFCPGGALAVTDGDAVVPVINRLAEGFGHVVLTQDWHPAGHSSFATAHEGCPVAGARGAAGWIKERMIEGGVEALAGLDPPHRYRGPAMIEPGGGADEAAELALEAGGGDGRTGGGRFGGRVDDGEVGHRISFLIA